MFIKNMNKGVFKNVQYGPVFPCILKYVSNVV